MDYWLKQLTPGDGMDIYDMLQEIPRDECGFVNGASGRSVVEYSQWLEKSDVVARGIGLEDWQVPQTTYWFYVDGRPVGFGKVRHRLTQKLQIEGGHIGYAIRPSARGRGYGKMLLKCLLGEAWKLGIPRVLITIHEGNASSLGVALANGGVIEKTESGRHYILIDQRK